MNTEVVQCTTDVSIIVAHVSFIFDKEGGKSVEVI